MSAVIEKILFASRPQPVELVRSLKDKGKEKYDYLLDAELLDIGCSVGVLGRVDNQLSAMLGKYPNWLRCQDKMDFDVAQLRLQYNVDTP